MVDRSRSARVPVEVGWVPAWLTWVGATTSCLQALKCGCDAVDVAGVCGYAFQLTVHRELCPSGPTVFSWARLSEGVPYLGRTALQFLSMECYEPSEGSAGEGGRQACAAAFNVASAEVEAGRPCVLWGAYVPEFAVVVGVENGCYLVKSFRRVMGQPEEPVPWDQLAAPGGPYVLAFPSATGLSLEAEDRRWVERAVEALQPALVGAEGATGGDYRFGTGAYDFWAEALEGGKFLPFGAAYNAQCWAEARARARDFVGRVAERTGAGGKGAAASAEALTEATGGFTAVADSLAQVARLFPFPGTKDGPGPQACRAAAKALRAAKSAEERAAHALREAIVKWPRS